MQIDILENRVREIVERIERLQQEEGNEDRVVALYERMRRLHERMERLSND